MKVTVFCKKSPPERLLEATLTIWGQFQLKMGPENGACWSVLGVLKRGPIFGPLLDRFWEGPAAEVYAMEGLNLPQGGLELAH